MATVGLPLTGSGDSTANVAVDLIGGEAFQRVKLFDGTLGSTLEIAAKTSAPNSSDAGMLVRVIGLTSASTAVDATLTSAGSTRLVGQVTVANPTTGVTVNGAVGITSGSSAIELTSAGSTRLVGQVTVANPTTGVSVDGAVALTSAGSTRLAGRFDINNPTTNVTVDGTVSLASSTGQKGSIALASGTTGTMGAILLATGTTGLIGTVGVSSGVILGAGSTANSLGSVALVAGSSGNVVGAVAQGAGSTSVSPWYVYSTGGGAGSTAVDANLTSVGSTRVIGTVGVSSGVVLGPSTAMTGMISSGTQTIGSVQLSSAGTTGSIGSVALLAGSSANMVGQVSISTGNLQYLGLGTSANYQFTQSIPFSSGNVTRSSVSSTVDTQFIAANANRKALIIANRSTVQTVGIGFSTGVVTTALANVDVFLAPSAALSFGLHGGLPLYLGPLRGINLTSTAVGGSVGVTEFT